tara:strand:+ start:1434 stop:1796 length:363 start_codon:yes stop_codon:yes gene_type:complete
MAGGRPQGSINKNAQFLLSRLQDMYGDEFHPIMKMAENANRLQNIVDDIQPDDDTDDLKDKDIDRLFFGIKLAGDAWEKVAKYVQPQLKAIDHSGNISTRPMLVDLSGGKLTEANQEDED